MAQSTKHLLFCSFKELLATESVSKITITDITDRVGVNRHTFYYHFKDINSLVTWGFENAIGAFLGKQVPGTHDWSESMRKIIYTTNESKKFILALYHSDLKDHLTRLLRDCAGRLVHAIIQDGCSDMVMSEADKNFVQAFIANGISGVAIDWFEGGMMEGPDEIADQMVKLTAGNFREILSGFSYKG